MADVQGTGNAPVGYIEKRNKRGPIGYVVLILFLCFNALMLYSCMGAAIDNHYLWEAGQISEEERDVRNGLATFALLIPWAAGSIVLGIPVLLTRGRKQLVPIAPADQESGPTTKAGGRSVR